MNWYYVENEQQVGPMDDARLAELVRTGIIRADTLVWRAGMDGWKPYGEINSAAAPAAPVSSSATNASEVVCVECKQIFPAEETIRYGNARVCAACKPVFMQKLSEGAQINTGELRYARIGTRFAAMFLDGLILGVTNMLLGLVVGMLGVHAARGNAGGFALAQIILFAVELGIGMTYETLMIGKYGATLGKMACKIKVVTADGGPVSYGRAFGRYFAKMLSAFTCLIGYIIAIFDNPQKRALHDHVCNTRVVLK